MNGKQNPAGANGGGKAENASGAFSHKSIRPGGARQRVPIRVGGRTVGEVRGDIFVKRVQASRHFLRTPPAICFDVSTLKDAERAGAQTVEVTDADTGRVYRASMGTMWAKGRSLNRGYGEQWRLDLRYWNTGGQGGEPPIQQLPLLGGQV